MKTPAFWSKDASPLPGLLLSPLGLLYGLGTRIRLASNTGWRAPVPVICVGNLVAGGAGKTPVVMDLAARIGGAQIVSRGYGGSETGPVNISSAAHTAAQVGDEPLLMCGLAPVWVSRDRRAGCEQACQDGAQVLILDDGFQDPAIIKNLSLVVVDGGYGFGNGHKIPAGPLRESVASGLSRADAVIIIGKDTGNIETRIAGRCPVLHASLAAQDAAHWQGKKVVAFAGIGRPEKFFQSLRDVGCEICEALSFADHHPYSAGELDNLKHRAEKQGAVLVTTRKDLVRIAQPDQKNIEALTVNLKWDDVSQIEALLAQHITR